MCVKCLFYAVVSAVTAAGLSACDDGKIAESLVPQSPDGGDAVVDATLLDAVQRQVFNARCVQCHGGSNHAAAGLYLTAGSARESLVGVASEVEPGAVRVVAGNHAASLLWQAVATDISKNWSFNHSELITPDAVYLTATWIDLEK